MAEADDALAIGQTPPDLLHRRWPLSTGNTISSTKNGKSWVTRYVSAGEGGHHLLHLKRQGLGSGQQQPPGGGC